jgi:hypothetical protein
MIPLLSFVFAAVPASAELVATLEKTWISRGGYEKNIQLDGESVEKGWHTVKWTGYVGWEGEPKRTQGANKFVFQYRGVPTTIKNNGKYMIEYRWKRLHAGALEPGKPYKHESNVTLFTDSACTKSGGGSYSVDIPQDKDSYEDKVEITCWDGHLGGVGSHPEGHIGINGRPWGGFQILFRWATKEKGAAKK